jgi:hypothetical protein
MRLIFEIVTLIAIVLIALLAPPTKSTRLGRVRQWYRSLARRPRLAMLLIGATVLMVEATFAALVQKPIAANMDEFSYLLAGDTFAHGRLTNPPHSLWEHFESYNIIQQPTYQSKYPPGQGLVLALGQSCFGDPAVGVWLNLAVACAAVCWMLYGWLPPRWALLGAILAVLNVSLLRHWGQSYWGGGVALLGGALLFGSLPRIQREPRLIHGLLIGIGLSLLANSRPYESLIAVLPAAAWFGWQLFATRRRIRENSERKRGRSPFVHSTLRAVPAKGDGPLFLSDGTRNAPNSHEFGYGTDRGLLLRRVIAPAAALYCC